MIFADAAAPAWVLLAVAVLTTAGVVFSARSSAKSQRASSEIAERVERAKSEAKVGAGIFDGYDDLTKNYKDAVHSLTAEVEALRVEARLAREDLAKAQLAFRFVWGRLGFPDGYDPVADTERRFARVLDAVAVYDP